MFYIEIVWPLVVLRIFLSGPLLTASRIRYRGSMIEFRPLTAGIIISGILALESVWFWVRTASEQPGNANTMAAIFATVAALVLFLTILAFNVAHTT